MICSFDRAVPLCVPDPSTSLLSFPRTAACFEPEHWTPRSTLWGISNWYASAAELTRLTTEDGFGAVVSQSYGQTFGKYSSSSRQSQNDSPGFVSSPGKLNY